MTDMTTHKHPAPAENPNEGIRAGEPPLPVSRNVQKMQGSHKDAVQEVASVKTQVQEDKHNQEQKTWAQEYIYSKNSPVLGTLGKWITAKPVEGILGGGTLGKVGRAAAIAAGVYFGLGALKQGAQAAFRGGNLLLDRIGIGGGHLFPSMDLPPAPPALQQLPPADLWSTA